MAESIPVPAINNKKGFQTGNQLWKRGQEVKNELKQKKMDVLLDLVAQGGVDQYANFMARLAQGGTLNQGESQFMDRYEKLFPYKQAKLSSVEQKVEITTSPFGQGHRELQQMREIPLD